MIERQRSADFVNAVINHPSVFPWVSGPITDPLDVSDAIENGSYIALMGEHGGYLFWRMADGIYDAHSAVLPAGRGKWALKAAKEALRVMFELESAKEIMMAAPQGNLAVHALIRSLRASYRGTIENGWFLDGHYVPSAIYSLTRDDWEKCRSLHH